MIARILLACLFVATNTTTAFVPPTRRPAASTTTTTCRPSTFTTIPDFVTTPVLKQVYPALLQHQQEYGNPNIPLGSKQGRQCEQLRRLHIQQALTEKETEWLESISFRFYSLEQVYETADFDQLYQRLLDYAQEHDGDVSPPKKYNADPELGAWVTGIRRKGVQHVDPRHCQRLDQIGFLWTSPRKCGSKFMKEYRALQEAVALQGHKAVWEKPDHQQWIRAQQVAAQRETLSVTRQHYIQELLQSDDNWVTADRPWER